MSRELNGYRNKILVLAAMQEIDAFNQVLADMTEEFMRSVSIFKM